MYFSYTICMGEDIWRVLWETEDRRIFQIMEEEHNGVHTTKISHLGDFGLYQFGSSEEDQENLTRTIENIEKTEFHH